MARLTGTLYGRIALILCATLLFSISVIAIHRRTVEQYSVEQQISAISQENAISANTLNTAFTMMEENVYNLPLYNRNFQELNRYNEQSTDGGIEYWAMISNIRQQMAALRSTYPYVESFFIYYPAQKLFLNNSINIEMTHFIQDLISNDNTAVFNYWKPLQLSNGTYLLLIYSYRDYYLGAWLLADNLSTYFSVGSASRNAFVYSITGTALSSATPQPELNLPAAGVSVKDRDHHILIHAAEHPGIYLVCYLNDEVLHSSMSLDHASFLLISLLHVLLLLFVMSAISVWVLRPIRTLTLGIQQIRDGRADYRLPVVPRDSSEFQTIQQEFNAMLDETQHMRIQIYEQKLYQDEINLRYLSQQIQPHFILNSLNMLNSYIGRDDDLARKLIHLLAKYYRYIINIESQYVKIGEEINHLENYLAFQKIRYSNRLHYTIECTPLVRQTPIPPLLLESFVGNVLKYGQDEDSNIYLQLSAYQKNDQTVCIRISDLGSGFPGEILDALCNYQKTGVRDELLGTGICNSLDRLKLIYGNNASIHFHNAEDHGAIVEIAIQSNQYKWEGSSNE